MFKNYNMFKPCGQYNTANFNQATESYHPMSFYIVEAVAGELVIKLRSVSGKAPGSVGSNGNGLDRHT